MIYAEVVLGPDAKPDRWAFVETFLNQFLFNCAYAYGATEPETRCLTLAQDLQKEFEWLKDLIIDTMIERMKKIQVFTSVLNDFIVYSNIIHNFYWMNITVIVTMLLRA